jgi:hypothetical protein
MDSTAVRGAVAESGQGLEMMALLIGRHCRTGFLARSSHMLACSHNLDEVG